MIYTSINQKVFQQIPHQSKRILDIGCGSGGLGLAIKQNLNCEVIGITYSEDESHVASQYLDTVIVADINQFDISILGKFDCIICSHILEHLHNPKKLLIALHKNLAEEGKLIIALPNVLFFKQRWEFIKGNFKYTDGGIMDKTHFHFFDWETSYLLLIESNWIVTKRIADVHFPLPLIRQFIRPLESRLNYFISLKFPSLFGTQFIFVAQSSQL
jgi:2-polyprenyl-3-methyl-5-hydroxy-6-metoxy-1,4-benzoquinol methylase